MTATVSQAQHPPEPPVATVRRDSDRRRPPPRRGGALVVITSPLRRRRGGGRVPHPDNHDEGVDAELPPALPAGGRGARGTAELSRPRGWGSSSATRMARMEAFPPTRASPPHGAWPTRNPHEETVSRPTTPLSARMAEIHALECTEPLCPRDVALRDPPREPVPPRASGAVRRARSPLARPPALPQPGRAGSRRAGSRSGRLAVAARERREQAGAPPPPDGSLGAGRLPSHPGTGSCPDRHRNSGGGAGRRNPEPRPRGLLHTRSRAGSPALTCLVVVVVVVGGSGCERRVRRGEGEEGERGGCARGGACGAVSP